MEGVFLSNGQTLLQKIRAYSSAKEQLERARLGTYFLPTEERQAVVEEATHDYNMKFIDIMDTLHMFSHQIDERLQYTDLIDGVREVLTSHFIAIFDQRQALNDTLARSSRDNRKEDSLVEFYFKNIRSPVADGLTDDVASVRSADALTEVTDRRNGIWLALMFKMFSWLFLHDFNPEDRMIERAEYQNNRLPVYIG